MNKPFRFESVKLPGAFMNRYGVVFDTGGRMADPVTRGIVQREALAAGCYRAPDENDSHDVGTVWHHPK